METDTEVRRAKLGGAGVALRLSCPSVRGSGRGGSPRPQMFRWHLFGENEQQRWLSAQARPSFVGLVWVIQVAAWIEVAAELHMTPRALATARAIRL